MIKFLVSLSLILTLFSFTHPPKKIKVVFFGDSITEFGVQPTGYITKIDSIIRKQKFAESIELVGAGISRHKVYDLYLRMEDDVLAKKPDVIVIYVGINDIMHKVRWGTGTDQDRFDKFYRAIIKRLREKNIKVVVCTPSVIGERNDNSNEQDGDLNQYGKIIRNIAAEYSLPVCDLRKSFARFLTANNSPNNEVGILTKDRVHLNEKGNLFVAEEMWKVLQPLLK